MGISSGISTHSEALHPMDPRSNWNLEMLVFAEGGKLENQKKNS